MEFLLLFSGGSTFHLVLAKNKERRNWKNILTGSSFKRKNNSPGNVDSFRAPLVRLVKE